MKFRWGMLSPVTVKKTNIYSLKQNIATHYRIFAHKQPYLSDHQRFPVSNTMLTDD